MTVFENVPRADINSKETDINNKDVIDKKEVEKEEKDALLDGKEDILSDNLAADDIEAGHDLVTGDISEIFDDFDNKEENKRRKSSPEVAADSHSGTVGEEAVLAPARSADSKADVNVKVPNGTPTSESSAEDKAKDDSKEAQGDASVKTIPKTSSDLKEPPPMFDDGDDDDDEK